jgi:hypothetical protein
LIADFFASSIIYLIVSSGFNNSFLSGDPSPGPYSIGSSGIFKTSKNLSLLSFAGDFAKKSGEH